jgi:ABC-type transporter Mla subunit MlaD
VGTAKRERQKANRQLRQQQEDKQDQRRRLTRRVGLVAGLVVVFVLVVWLVGRSSGGDDNDNTPTVTEPSASVDTVAAGEAVVVSTVPG